MRRGAKSCISVFYLFLHLSGNLNFLLPFPSQPNERKREKPLWKTLYKTSATSKKMSPPKPLQLSEYSLQAPENVVGGCSQCVSQAEEQQTGQLMHLLPTLLLSWR